MYCPVYLIKAPFAWITASSALSTVSWEQSTVCLLVSSVCRHCDTKAISGFWYLSDCGQVLSPGGKHPLHKPGQQREVWSALKLPSRWFLALDVRKHRGATAADGTKSMLNVKNSHWTASGQDSLHLHFSSKLISKWNGNLLWYEKRTLRWQRGLNPGKLLLLLHTSVCGDCSCCLWFVNLLQTLGRNFTKKILSK